MSHPLLQSIESLAKEKGIDPQLVIGAIEEAVATASRKAYKTGENLKARLNPDSGDVDLFAVKEVVEEVTNSSTEIALGDAQTMYRELYGDEYASAIEVGDEIEFPKSKEPLGRIAAQTAKQVIFQKVREAERENIYEEYSQRVGEVVTATVKRFESGDIVAEIGRAEAILPRREQSRAENYSVGDRLRAVIKSVNKNVKGPQVLLSRTDPALLVKLFEQEVPEIYDGTVMIRGAVREAGDRAKVAVFSRERDVDPVGACVGMKGTRVQAIIRELRGEKIDIVEWSEDPVEFVTNSISPARVQRVSIVDETEKVMEVVVEDKQLSLAIGKKGQNVRLAAKLTGWKIDIKSEEEKRKEVERQLEGLAFEPAEATDVEPAATDASSEPTGERAASDVESPASDDTPAEASDAMPAGATDAAPAEASEAVPAEGSESSDEDQAAPSADDDPRAPTDESDQAKEAVASANGNKEDTLS